MVTYKPAKKTEDFKGPSKAAFGFGKYVVGPLQRAFTPSPNSRFFGRDLADNTAELEKVNKALNETIAGIRGKEPKFPHNIAGAF